MEWIAVTEADILTVLSGPELAGIRAAALKAGQVDPVPPTTTAVINLVRGYVAGCGKYIMGAGETIPDGLLVPALDILAVRIPARVSISSSEERKDAMKSATALLEQVQKGNFGLAVPLVAAEEAISTGGTPSISGRTRRESRRERNGE